MMTNSLEAVWDELETRMSNPKAGAQIMICPELLYRVYAGVIGIPSKRYLVIEIPESQKKEFDSFSVPKGISLSIVDPIIKHSGFVACLLEATSADQNDVFTIVAEDILNELNKKDVDKFVVALKQRIEKWKDFFKNPERKQLSEEVVIGLIGELSLIEDLLEQSLSCATELWNGPLKAAQDFQGDTIAFEVKTSCSSQVKTVKISSEIQLDDSGRSHFLLVVNRLERDDAFGRSLPEYVSSIYEKLPAQKKRLFLAKLKCLGYDHETSEIYTQAYSLKERFVYTVAEGFPRILSSDLKSGVTNVNYRVRLSECEDYLTDFDQLIDIVRMCEHG